MGDFIVVLIILAILGLSLAKLRKDKKNGVKCSGCGHSENCPSKGTPH